MIGGVNNVAVDIARAEFDKWIKRMDPNVSERSRVEWNIANALQDRVLEALSATPAAQVTGGVEVKPLEWKPSFGSIQYATALGWRYMIGLDGDVWRWWRENVPHRKGKAASEVDAKAAAQADYDARIRAALTGGEA